MSNTPELGQRRRINWLHLNTVLSAAVLIGAEVFGAAYALGWAVENLTGLGSFIIGIGVSIVNITGANVEAAPGVAVGFLRVLFFAIGAAVMIAFVRQASKVEPFTSRQ
jgi:hypothetical protein